MPKTKKEKVEEVLEEAQVEEVVEEVVEDKKEINSADYDDYGDYMTAKKKAGEVKEEENAS